MCWTAGVDSSTMVRMSTVIGSVSLPVEGRVRNIPARWLRLHCPCDRCQLVAIGERRVRVGLDADDATIEAVETAGDVTTVRWRSGHTSTYTGAGLDALQARTRRRSWRPVHWRADHRVHEIDHDTLLADEEARRTALLAYRNEGVLVVRGIPTDGMATEGFLVDDMRIPIWDGPFGRIIDTQVQKVAYNVAETAEALPPHTDLAGYVWPPSGQILHMLVNECVGGDSIVIDGWLVLEELRRDEPALFDALTGVTVAHRLYSAERETFARAPLVRLGGYGDIAGIRYSNQTLEPVSLDEPRLEVWLEAYAELTRRLADPDRAAGFRLETGDAYLTHAHRVLHARTAFVPDGERCIRDVYFEFDNVLAILDQLTGDVPQ